MKKFFRRKKILDQYQINCGEFIANVDVKRMRSIRLSVNPPYGEVRVSASHHASVQSIRSFLISRKDWIKKHQEKIRDKKYELPKAYLSGEEHYFLGEKYSLMIVEKPQKPQVQISNGQLILQVRDASDKKSIERILQSCYRSNLKEIAQKIIIDYEKLMQVKVKELGIKKMKTRWGTCNPRAARIWLNLELAKRSTECVEYIIVHEMVHLLEKNHNKRFVAYMNCFLPNWKLCKEQLNHFPL